MLKLKESISYGLGNLGICLITTVFSVFAAYFYTNVVGISILHAGSIMLIGGIVDAISDIVMDMIVDKTNTRWGKSRPYLLIMAIPLVVISFLAFNVADASETVKYVYSLITYCLYTCAYTAVFIPYSTLMSSITANLEDRLSVNMWQGLGSSIGQFIINSFALSIVAKLGDGISGYRTTILIFGVAAAILLIICFSNTKERVTPPKGEKIGLKDTLQAFKNIQWLIVCFTVFLALTAVILRAQQTMYYAQYIMNDIDIAPKLLAISTGANFIITHEPTWYTGHDTTEWLANDDVYIAKKKLLEENHITVWRFHDHMHMATDEDGIYRGFERKMNWQNYRIPYNGTQPEFGGSYEIPGTTLKGLADEFSRKIGMNVIQIVGKEDMPVRRVGVYVGGGSLGLGTEERPMQHMRENNLDVAVCGDITEWTLSAYINDAKALGINRAMLVLGHERSEEMGMEYLGEWLKDITGETEIIFIDAKEPFSYFIYPANI